MKKIKSIGQLKAEKKRLALHQAHLENKLRGQWTDLKVSLKPANIAKEAYSSVMNNKAAENNNTDSIFKSTLNYGVSLLTKKITDTAGKQLSKLFAKKKNGKRNDD
jgi:Flp pilus assembly protein CpaB